MNNGGGRVPMAGHSLQATRATGSTPFVWMCAAALTVLHLATAGRYGIFRDELYYLACAPHLDWGFVDQPPLIAWVTWCVVHTLGTSLLTLRLLPALASGALVWLTAALVRELGGGRFAQALSAIAIASVPIYLVLDHWLTMNAFEPLIWTGVLWSLVRVINTGDARYWLPAGALLGIGLENKYSIALLGVGLCAGLAVTADRRWLRSPWFWGAVALAILLFLPNLLWLVDHQFPFVEFEQNSRMSRSRIQLGPIAFVADQMRIMNPLLAPVWISGCVWLFRSGNGRYRSLGWVFVFVFATWMILKAKNYYVAPLYPLAVAAGAVAVEHWAREGRKWIRPVYLGALALSILVLAPLVMPILSIPGFLAYQKALGGLNLITFERRPSDELPQYFSDEFGWEEMVRRTAAAYQQLPEEERQRTAIFANNYGQAAAVDFFGPAYGLPPAISNHESYWLWGPREYTGGTVIVLGSDGRGDREHFRVVEVAGHVGDPYARAEEQFDLFLCHDLNRNLQDFWPGIRKW